MTQRHESDPDATGEAPESLRLARRIAELYAPPPSTEAARRRFDARLEARLAARPRPWGLALATAATALALVLLGQRVSERAAPGPAAGAAAGAEAVLALATDPVAEADEALPAEYRAISFLILDAEGAIDR